MKHGRNILGGVRIETELSSHRSCFNSISAACRTNSSNWAGPVLPWSPYPRCYNLKFSCRKFFFNDVHFRQTKFQSLLTFILCYLFEPYKKLAFSHCHLSWSYVNRVTENEWIKAPSRCKITVICVYSVPVAFIYPFMISTVDLKAQLVAAASRFALFAYLNIEQFITQLWFGSARGNIREEARYVREIIRFNSHFLFGIADQNTLLFVF